MDPCQHCKFWSNNHPVKGYGYCRRYAPRPVSKEDACATEVMGVIVGWPVTYEDEGCGEFKLDVRKL